MGHATPFVHLANILAEKGHSVTLLLPNKAKLLLQSSNLYPSLVTIQTITVPHVDPLPPGTQTLSDIPLNLQTHLATALDRFRPEFESILDKIKPNLVVYDFAYWVPEAVAASGIKAKCLTYCVTYASILSLDMVPSRDPPKDKTVVEENACVACNTPPGNPTTTVTPSVPKKHRSFLDEPRGEGVTFYQRVTTALKCSDAIAIKTCREIEGKYCDKLSNLYNNKPVLTVLDLPEPKEENLDTRWAEWLGRFAPDSVVFCAFGSQIMLNLAQFQEILLGFEMIKLPFLVAFKPPIGYATVEEALPEGFAERVGDRGVVTGEWVQQTQILAHPSVGCFVNHCGSGSIWESMLSKSQIVLVPQLADQKLFSKILVEEVKVAVQVERGEDGSWVSKESLCKAVELVMNEESEIGILVKKNHEIWRKKLLDPGYMRGNINSFINDLESLVFG
uniref:Glycosyltransferase n=2 Tax=Chenopodium quinoa TaxID=63459 RepID=A0A803MBQ1_CHEQI